MSDKIDQLVDSMKELIELELKKIALMRELVRAYRFAQLLGLNPKDMTGKLRSRVEDSGSACDAWRGATLHVTYDNEERMFKLKDVNMDLWPDRLRDQYERHLARKEKLKERRPQ